MITFHSCHLQGELTRIYERWRKELIAAMAHTEARIDFGEEQLEDESMDGSKLHHLPCFAKKTPHNIFNLPFVAPKSCRELRS